MLGRTTTHHKEEEIEDRLSSSIIIVICFIFLVFVVTQGLSFGKGTKESGGIPNLNISSRFLTKYNCPLHNNDFDACVKVQKSGKGCSWYADCRKCIVEDNKAKSRDEICGE